VRRRYRSRHWRAAMARRILGYGLLVALAFGVAYLIAQLSLWAYPWPIRDR